MNKDRKKAKSMDELESEAEMRKRMEKTTSGFIHQSELPRLDEEAVKKVLYGVFPTFRPIDEAIDIVAKAICSKFSPRVVKLPKEKHPFEWEGSHGLFEEGYNRCLADCKQSLEEQGIKTEGE